MKRLSLALAALLISTAAYAGSLTITYRNDANNIVGTPEVSTISNANMARLIAMVKANYGKVASGPPVNGIVPMRDMTSAEAVQRWWKGIWQGTRDNIINNEKSTASKTASDAVVAVPE